LYSSSSPSYPALLLSFNYLQISKREQTNKWVELVKVGDRLWKYFSNAK
jgi:hypothetical protein